MPTLEGELARLEARVEEAQKSAKALASALVMIRTAVQGGVIADIEKGLATLSQRGQEAADSAAKLSNEWSFDTRAYLADGFAEELRAAATVVGLDLIERDGRLSAFPMLLQVEPKDLAVRIGKRLERRIRPGLLTKSLALVQKKPQRFSEQRFLNLLYRAYRHVCEAGWKGSGRGPLKPLANLHAVLTLLPDSDYSLQEFGRDLLQLDRKPELRTSDGARAQFEGATLGKGSVQRINVYDEHGMQHVYIAIRFVN